MQEVTTKQRFRNNKYRLEMRERDHLPMHGIWLVADLTC